MSSKRLKDVLVLFDVDGTLTEARKTIKPEMKAFLKSLRDKVYIGVVGGSDHVKIAEQLGGNNMISEFDYVFSENGLVAYLEGKQAESQDIKKFLGEDQLQSFLNFTLKYLAELKLPKKRGTFIELRNGMINISPIGRNCSHDERDEFQSYDNVHGVRKTMVEALKKEFPNIGLQYSIGGQISFDVFPVGWDKTYCLNHLQSEGFKTIHFFGDKTQPGGNDYEIYTSDKVVGHSVKNPDDTRAQLTELFFK